MPEPPPKKPRLGQRKRLQPALASEEQPATTSRLADYLAHQWSWGYMPAQTIQKLACLALEDMAAAGVGQPPSKLQALASIGSFGAHSNNCHRDITNLLLKDTLVSKPLQHKLPLKGGVYLQSIMLPHELFHCMWANYRPYFFQVLAPGGEKRLKEFWKSFSKHPSMAIADFKTHPSFPSKCLPCGLHGEAAPTTGVGKVWTKMQFCFSWHSLTRYKGNKASSYLAWSVLGPFSINSAFL